MGNIIIKKDFLAERCEVCNQSDYFDPLKSYCKRCNKIELLYKKRKKKKGVNQNHIHNQLITDGIKYPIMIFCIFISILFWIGLFSEYGSCYIGENLAGIMLILMITIPSIGISTICKMINKNHR